MALEIKLELNFPYFHVVPI
uniref:Uncharacterized protein n=1 Tax=Arundo donax TaxID=35708 RepID=A0A0A8ZF81_ARUDO